MAFSSTLALAVFSALMTVAASADAQSFVFRKPVAGATKCPTPEACALPARNGFNPNVVIAQGRFIVRHWADGNFLDGAGRGQATATTGDTRWQFAGVTPDTAAQYRVISRGTDPTTGAATYTVVPVANATAAARAGLNAYLSRTFTFSGEQRFSVTLQVKPEACAAVAAAKQADVTCAGNVVTATLLRPAVPVYFPNSGVFAVFGGHNLHLAGAYAQATSSWRNPAGSIYPM